MRSQQSRKRRRERDIYHIVGERTRFGGGVGILIIHHCLRREFSKIHKEPINFQSIFNDANEREQKNIFMRKRIKWVSL